MRLLRHWRDSAENSISIMLSQEAHLGVKWNSKRCERAKASSAGKVS